MCKSALGRQMPINLLCNNEITKIRLMGVMKRYKNTYLNRPLLKHLLILTLKLNTVMQLKLLSHLFHSLTILWEELFFLKADDNLGIYKVSSPGGGAARRYARRRWQFDPKIVAGPQISGGRRWLSCRKPACL